MSFRLSLIVYLSIFSFSICFSQEELDSDFTIKGMAIGISSPEMIDQMMAIMPGIGSNARSMTNEQSVKSYFMPPRRVGERGTVTSYTLAACLEYYHNFQKNYKVNLSPDYLAQKLFYEKQRDIKNALRLLVTDGTVTADIVPYDAERIASNMTDVASYHISNYLHIFNKDKRNSLKVFEVQKALMRGNPVIVEMNVPGDFKRLKKTRFYTSLNDARDKKYSFIVVGYNLELEAFEILSSWGSGWASDGYLWVEFEDFGEMAQNGFVMVPVGG
ncbi:MAG: C1 family peptidase [Bacteroidota bacterium]